MKINLDKIEEKLKHIFENSFLTDSYTQLHHNLVKDLCNIFLKVHQVDENGVNIAPNDFTIFLSDKTYKSIEKKSDLVGELSETLNELIADTGIVTLVPITISFHTDPDLENSDFKLKYAFTNSVMETTSVFDLENQEDVLKEELSPMYGYLIFDEQIIPITEPVYNIGRGDGNNLIIDNRFISRAHAQIRYINSRYVIFDLNSTGGTYINGKRIKQYNLKPGDVISLSKIDIVFGIENDSTLADTSKFLAT